MMPYFLCRGDNNGPAFAEANTSLTVTIAPRPHDYLITILKEGPLFIAWK